MVKCHNLFLQDVAKSFDHTEQSPKKQNDVDK